MALGFEVTFADDHVFFPDNHLSRIGGSFDGTLAAAAIQDADPAAAPPEIQTKSGETLFVSALQRQDLERFCQASQVPIRKRPDVWGDLLEPFLDAQLTPQHEAATLSRLHQAGLTDAEIDPIRTKVRPLMLAYNAYHWDWHHLGLADLLDAATTARLPEHRRADLGQTTSLYMWAMAIANGTGPQPAAQTASETSGIADESMTQETGSRFKGHAR
jgi:hypothetical protein